MAVPMESAAKDVTDIQIRVPSTDDQRMTIAFERNGYRRRPESSNNLEATRTGDIPKLVFAPPANTRSCNVHVRTDGTTGARDALLFRDCRRQDERLRQTWGLFKAALAESLADGDLLTYGRVKQPAWTVLMHAADALAREADWQQEPISDWPRQLRNRRWRHRRAVVNPVRGCCVADPTWTHE